MFMSLFCANYEFDLKKVIALSTLRQLGLIIRSLFLGSVNLSFYHLLTHLFILLVEGKPTVFQHTYLLKPFKYLRHNIN